VAAIWPLIDTAVRFLTLFARMRHGRNFAFRILLTAQLRLFFRALANTLWVLILMASLVTDCLFVFLHRMLP
jgi:hypothetical protein